MICTKEDEQGVGKCGMRPAFAWQACSDAQKKGDLICRECPLSGNRNVFAPK